MRSKFKWIYALVIALTMQFSFAQQKTVTGTVKDDKGMPLVGANVKNGKDGVATNADGKFAIKANQGDELKISYQGMQNSVITVGPSDNYNVKMTSKDNVLEEVLVTGAMGVRKKKEAITYTQQQVSNKEIMSAQNPNAVRALTGKVSGVTINNTSNGVAGATSIKVRSPKSILGSTEALIVIDNVVSDASVFAATPPDQIESVNVIKGAQGSALYGELGVNGVIVVTTKRPSKAEKLRVTFNSAVDFETVSFVPEKQQKYGQGWDGAWDQYENGGWGELMDGSIRPVGMMQADGTYIEAPYSPIKDNIKQFYKTGVTSQNSVGFNLGGDNEYVVLNLSNVRNSFMVKGDELNRNVVLFKAGKKINKFSVDGSFHYINSRTKQSDVGSTLLELQQGASNIPFERFDNGNGLGGWNVYYSNPYWRRDNNRLNNQAERFNTGLSLGLDVNKYIDIKYNGSLQVSLGNQMSYSNELEDTSAETAAHNADLSQTSTYYNSSTSSRYYYGDLMVNFKYDFSENIKSKLTLGQNMTYDFNRRVSVGGQNLDIPGWYHINNVTSPDLFRNLRNSESLETKVGYFANLDLSYKNYLFLNATARTDESSKIPGKSYFYPSAGISFVPTSMKDGGFGKTLNYLKIYGNITSVGSTNALSPYQIADVSALAPGFPFGDSSSYTNLTSVTNPNIKPELSTTYEVGFNAGFLQDKLSLNVALYQTDTKNLITESSNSYTTGITNFTTNLGKLRSKGVEVDLGFDPFKNKAFKWDGRISFTSYDTKVIDSGETDVITLYDLSNSPNSNISGTIVAMEGESFPYLMGSDWLRDSEGRVIIDATTGLPTADPVQKKLGKVTPDYILGFTNNFSYKGIGLSFTLDYRTGHKVFAESIYNMSWSGHLVDSAEFDRDLGFVFPNSVVTTGTPGVYVPNSGSNEVMTAAGYSPTTGVVAYYGIYGQVGSNNIIDATALKVREIALSYTLPSRFTKSIGIQSCKLSVNARNPFIVLAKENKGYADPESNNIYNSGTQNASTRITSAQNTAANGAGFSQIGQYPSSRTFGFSINVGF